MHPYRAGHPCLEAERRRLEDAHKEFAEWLDTVRKAKDREEFERFMAARRARQLLGTRDLEPAPAGRLTVWRDYASAFAAAWRTRGPDAR